MKHSHYVVFGAWKEPDKVLIVAKTKNGPGKWALIIGQALNDGRYTYGDEVREEDVESIYTTLYFCKPESLDAFINALTIMREAWNKENAGGVLQESSGKDIRS
ncbi:MAG: hypothetical protein IJ673_12725 [Treponema sp.]|nr:hypothetical protein [Treponema sp.]